MLSRTRDLLSCIAPIDERCRRAREGAFACQVDWYALLKADEGVTTLMIDASAEVLRLSACLLEVTPTVNPRQDQRQHTLLVRVEISHTTYRGEYPRSGCHS